MKFFNINVKYIINYPISIVFLVSTLIFLWLDKCRSLSIILMPLVTAGGLIYNMENKRFESNQEKENVKEILAREIGWTTLSLEKFLNTKGSSKVQAKNSVKSWKEFSNRSYINIFETKEILLLHEFFSKVKDIDEQGWFNTPNNNFNPQNLKPIREVVLEGEKILKEIFKDWDKFKLDEYEISQLEFNNIINTEDLESLEFKILDLNKQGKSIGLIKKINTYYFDIPEDNIPLWIEFLLKKGNILNIPIKIFGYSDVLIFNAVKNLISMLRDQPDIIFDIIKKCSSQEYASLYYIMSLIHKSAFEGILNDNQIEYIKDCVMDKIKRLSKNGKLLNCSHLYMLLEFWDLFGGDREVIKTFLDECLEDKNKLIKLIRGLSHNMNSTIHLNQDYTKIKSNPKIETISIERYIDAEFKEKLVKIEYSNEENKELFEKFKYSIISNNFHQNDDIKTCLYDEIKNIFFKLIGFNNEIVMIENSRKEDYVTECSGTDDKISIENICKIWEEYYNYIHETFEQKEIEQIERFLEIVKKMENSSNYLFKPSTPPEYV